MFSIFKVIFSKEYDFIPSKSDGKALEYGAYFLAFISGILSVLNVVKVYRFMTFATSFLVCGFIIAAIFAKNMKITVSRIIIAFLCAFVFSIFAITGQNDGFAILWILLVPIISPLLVGLKTGFYLSLYFQLFLGILFYSPLSSFICDYYTPTFIMRFPILYFAAFGATTFLMCQRQLLFHDIDVQSKRDSLTGLYNRCYFDIVCKEYSASPDDNLTFVVLDLNDLKNTNDTLGHEAGDELIHGAATIINDAFKTNMCFRTGGDEFVIITTDTDFKKSIDSLNALQNSWFGKEVDHLSISVGYASAADHPDSSLNELLKIADSKMYESKRAYHKREKSQ